jgi:hypothetical protein
MCGRDRPVPTHPPPSITLPSRQQCVKSQTQHKHRRQPHQPPGVTVSACCTSWARLGRMSGPIRTLGDIHGQEVWPPRGEWVGGTRGQFHRDGHARRRGATDPMRGPFGAPSPAATYSVLWVIHDRSVVCCRPRHVPDVPCHVTSSPPPTGSLRDTLHFSRWLARAGVRACDGAITKADGGVAGRRRQFGVWILKQAGTDWQAVVRVESSRARVEQRDSVSE